VKRADLILALIVLGGVLGSPFYNTALMHEVADHEAEQ
jgi:hypothetical protein